MAMPVTHGATIDKIQRPNKKEFTGEIRSPEKIEERPIAGDKPIRQSIVWKPVGSVQRTNERA